jgi:hypothetical protein
MRFAKHKISDELIQVASHDSSLIALSYNNQLICPCCEEGVNYFSGSSKVKAHFKHNRGVGTVDCENYVEGITGSPKINVNRQKTNNTPNSANINKQIEIECKAIQDKKNNTFINLTVTFKARPSTSGTTVSLLVQDQKSYTNTIVQSTERIRKSLIISLPLKAPLVLENCNCASTITYVTYVSELLQQHTIFPLKFISQKESVVLFRQKLYLDEIDAIFDVEPNFTNSIVFRTDANEDSLKNILINDGYDIKNGYSSEFCIYSPYLTNFNNSTFYFSKLEQIVILAFREITLEMEFYISEEKIDTSIYQVYEDIEKLIPVQDAVTSIKCINSYGSIIWFLLDSDMQVVDDIFAAPDNEIGYELVNDNEKIFFKRNDGLWLCSIENIQSTIKDHGVMFLNNVSWNNNNLGNGL